MTADEIGVPVTTVRRTKKLIAKLLRMIPTTTSRIKRPARRRARAGAAARLDTLPAVVGGQTTIGRWRVGASLRKSSSPGVDDIPATLSQLTIAGFPRARESWQGAKDLLGDNSRTPQATCPASAPIWRQEIHLAALVDGDFRSDTLDPGPSSQMKPRQYHPCRLLSAL